MNRTTSLLAVAVTAFLTTASAAEPPKAISIAESIPFDADVAGDIGILAAPGGNATRIKNECNLSQGLSGYIARGAHDKGIQVTRVANLDEAEGVVLHITIEGVMGYMGAQRTPKSLTLRGELRQGDTVLGSFVAREETQELIRNDCKGFDATAVSAALDIAKWLLAPTMKARLGEA
jgi:hypothetical protein